MKREPDRVRVSIGRLEMQVNNLPAPIPSDPQVSRALPETNAMELRFLGRFRLWS